MSPQIEAAQEVAHFLAEQRWEFCLIGGLALQQWGEPRTTVDADFTLLVGWGDEALFVDKVLAVFRGRISDAREFALQNRVLLIAATNGVSVDISLGALDFESEMIHRARTWQIGKRFAIPCCSAEDLVVMKAFSSRLKDWTDLQGILIRQSNLDKQYVLRHLKMLCDLRESPEIFERTAKLLGEGLE